jgi:hypothetical protein
MRIRAVHNKDSHLKHGNGFPLLYMSVVGNSGSEKLVEERPKRSPQKNQGGNPTQPGAHEMVVSARRHPGVRQSFPGVVKRLPGVELWNKLTLTSRDIIEAEIKDKIKELMTDFLW